MVLIQMMDYCSLSPDDDAAAASDMNLLDVIPIDVLSPIDVPAQRRT